MTSSTKLKSRPEVSIVIPAYKEGNRIGKTLDELANFIKTDKLLKTINIEIIVVAADAKDNTELVVLSKKHLFKDLRLLKPGPRVGKGRDVKYGMLRAKGKAVMFMDADLATPLKYLPRFYKYYLGGQKLIIATRNLHKHHPNLLRRWLSNCGNLLFRFAGGVWIEDSQCGFKLFSSDVSKLCFSKLSSLGWGFDMEILAIAKANHIPISCVRINDWVSVPGGTFTDSATKNSLESLALLAKIFLNRLRKAYIS